MPKLSLYKAIKIGGLRDEQKQQKALNKYGFQLDTRLSNGRQSLVAYNPAKNNVLFIENGTDTSSRKDILTDLVLATGNLKSTQRYKETKQVYDAAKSKYKNASFTDVGSSLGGALVNYVSKPDDKVILYNAAFTPNQLVRQHVQNYIVKDDPISVYVPRNENTTILPNPFSPGQGLKDKYNYLLKTHKSDAIKDANIYV
jgi:hypothetical protein